MIAALRAEVEELRGRLGKDSSNSSKPLSSDDEAARASRRERREAARAQRKPARKRASSLVRRA